MNIRDLSQYIKNLCGEETLPLLGTNKELLLQKIYGFDPSPDQVKSVISDAASFASNAEEQLFYEFVQNAFDANADSLFFYANENYLIILNNGEPFYTDDIRESEDIREGQLYNFLAKGKSMKRRDPAKLGKYGQGSKLLYTLLTEVDDRKENEDLLINSIYEEKKGPYLISWNGRRQLANLLLKQPAWTPAQADDYENNILFAKILMSYYPIAPGVDEDLFSTQEALDAIDAFDTLVDPRHNIHYLNRGTALIIPLGKGKYDKITSKENLERVKTRLGGFASITRDQERNDGKTIEHIYVMGEEVDQHEVRSVFIEFDVEGNPFYYQFAFNPIFAEKNFVNLFKGLPILETKLRLGFIIDSQKFDTDNSRQRINDKSKTQVQLVRAFKELVALLKEIEKSDREKFDYIYKSLTATRIPDGEDFAYIRNSFREVFKPFFEEHILTTIGTYEKKENVRSFVSSKIIPLQEIGITKYKWADEETAKSLKRYNVEIADICLSSILEDTDPNKLQSWIKSLPRKEYAVFHKLIDEKKTERDVSSYKLFKTNLGNLYSFSELQSNANVYYPIEDNMPFGDCEHLENCIMNINPNSYIPQLYQKIKANIEQFRLTDSSREDAANLLGWIAGKDSNYLSGIKSQIRLLPNWHDEYMSFDELFKERPEGTILFDNYTVKGKTPDALNDKDWLLSPSKEKRSAWNWILRHWDILQEKEDWGEENTHRYISDIKKVYKSLGSELTTNESKLTLYLDSNAKPTKVLHASVNNASRLTETEYNLLGQEIPHLVLLPFEYQTELHEAPFKVEEVQSANIVKDKLVADERLLRIFIKITDDYLRFYRTQEWQGKYVVTKSSSGYNYIDDVSVDLKQELLLKGFYHIPDIVQSILKTEIARYRFVSNETMLIRAIENIEHPFKLLPFVKRANDNIVFKFFDNLNKIDIDNKITKEDYRWQIIELAVQRSNEDNDYVKLLFDLIRHNGNCLPDSITSQYVSLGNNQYNIYELDEDYKTDNETIDSFLKCLPSQTEIDYFKEHYYVGKEKEVSTEILYNNLHNTYMTIEQLRFCIDYSIANSASYYELEIKKDESVTEALKMILDNNFIGFDKYFKMQGVNYSNQIYAPQSFLSAEERLPSNIQNWIDSNQEILLLFTKLKTIYDPFIAVRKALINNEPYNNVSVFGDEDYKKEIDATINWAINKKLDYVYNAERYKTMMAILENLPNNYSPMPLLRYTGEVDKISDDEILSEPTFNLERCADNCSFLSVYSWGSQFEDRLRKSQKLKEFIQNNYVYAYEKNDLLFNHRLNDKPKWIIQASVDMAEFPEHTDPIYDEWKSMAESKGITIHTSKWPISMNFYIITDNVGIFSDRMHDSEYGYEAGKRVVVQQPNKEGLSLLKTIAKHISKMDFFKEPFIALQSLYVDKFEQGTGTSNLSLENSSLNEDQAQKALNQISSETAENLDKVNDITKHLDSEDLDKLKDSADSIKEILDIDKEDLQRLAEKKDKIMQMLDDIDDAEEEEKESQVRMTIGFIGELIYSHYLNNKQKKYIHAALKGVGEYDFEVLSDNTYVDVKTTLYSLKDGTAPFYLHKSQNSFMQKHPDSKYHIVRISLIDLNLKKTYEEIRDEYGKDANPLENKNLRKRCEQIAKNYWRGAKIEEFDALSPEYVIRIEQKLN